MADADMKPGMVRVRRGRRAFIPALLIRIVGEYAVIKPMGHRRSEMVALRAIKPWKSRTGHHRS